MTIRLTDNTTIEHVSLCAKNSIRGDLVIEIDGVGIAELANITERMNDTVKTATLTCVNERNDETVFDGFTSLDTVGYNGIMKVITLFMSKA